MTKTATPTTTLDESGRTGERDGYEGAGKTTMAQGEAFATIILASVNIRASECNTKEQAD